MGLRVGSVIGILEGIAESLEKEHGEKARMEQLVKEAREELKTERVFGKEYWGDDGVWHYTIPGEHEDGREITWKEVVDAHPSVRKWEAIVKNEVEKWSVDVGILEREDVDGEMKEDKKAIEW